MHDGSIFGLTEATDQSVWAVFFWSPPTVCAHVRTYVFLLLFFSFLLCFIFFG